MSTIKKSPSTVCMPIRHRLLHPIRDATPLVVEESQGKYAKDQMLRTYECLVSHECITFQVFISQIIQGALPISWQMILTYTHRNVSFLDEKRLPINVWISKDTGKITIHGDLMDGIAPSTDTDDFHLFLETLPCVSPDYKSIYGDFDINPPPPPQTLPPAPLPLTAEELAEQEETERWISEMGYCLECGDHLSSDDSCQACLEEEERKEAEKYYLEQCCPSEDDVSDYDDDLYDDDLYDDDLYDDDLYDDDLYDDDLYDDDLYDDDLW